MRGTDSSLGLCWPSKSWGLLFFGQRHCIFLKSGLFTIISQLYGFYNCIKKKSSQEAQLQLDYSQEEASSQFGVQSRQTWYRISVLSLVGPESIHVLGLESGGKGSGSEITSGSPLPGGRSQIAVSLTKPSISFVIQDYSCSKNPFRWHPEVTSKSSPARIPSYLFSKVPVSLLVYYSWSITL